MRAIKKLLEIIAYLRSKDGCAWDKKQTHESLLPHLEEETWEVMDAVKKKLYKKELKEELADVLLQVIMHSQIASEKKNFDFFEVVEYLNQKLIRRHPHIFNKNTVAKDFDIEKEWHNIKAKEQGKKYHPLERVPASSSAAYHFKKIKSFATENPQVNLDEIITQIQSLKKETDKKKISLIMGKIFYDLASLSEQKGLAWEELFKDFLNSKKNKILKNSPVSTNKRVIE